MTRRTGLVLVGAAVFLAAGAPFVAPYAVDTRFPRLLNAPPTALHIVDDSGRWQAPFIYRWRLVSQLEQLYEEDRSQRVPLVWLSAGRLVSSSAADAPLLLLGADGFGHDVLTRLLFGARTSLTLAATAALGAILIGAVAGALAGYAGGTVDDVLMRGVDFVMVLPAMYVALALRSVLPVVMTAPQVFWMLTLIFSILGAPFIARGVRSIVRTERRLDYAIAAEALGAGAWRLLLRHLLPATRGFVAVQMTVLVPAFIVAEATLSYVGLGFPDPVASWGTMLHEASTNIRVFTDFPWLLSPAAAMFLVVLGLNLVLQDDTRIQSIR
jgi:peptide/nickel transport system permease protein